MKFGDFLKKKRCALGYTQAYVAKMLGVLDGTVSRYERNLMLPQQPCLRDYREILNVSVEEFYSAYENHGRNDNSLLNTANQCRKNRSADQNPLHCT